MIMCSGRGEEQREVTEKWPTKPWPLPVKLYMRQKVIIVSDDIIKSELLDQIRQDGWDPK